MDRIMVIDTGGTAIKWAVMDVEANIITSGDTPTPTTSLEEFLVAFDSVILPHKDEVVGIALSLPGKIDPVTGYMYTAGALSSFLTNVPFKDVMEKRYGLPTTIDNDGKCAAAAEAWMGSLADVNNGMVLVLGTGIGGGIVLNKKVWKGWKGAAGEVSGLPTNYEDMNNNPMWAQLNGYKGLTSTYAEIKGLDPKEVNGFTYFEAYHAGDEDAIKVMDHFCKTLLSGIITIQAILDVEKYVIGGGISAEDALIENIRQTVDNYWDHLPPYVPFNRPVIEKCRYRNAANLIGALKNWLDQNRA